VRLTAQQKTDIAALDRVQTQGGARRVVKRARFRRLNARRAELIRQDTPGTDPELAELQRVCLRIVDLAHPLPPAPDLSALEQRLQQESARCE